MHYEEKRIDGIWHFRYDPTGEWKVMGFVNLNEKNRQLEKEVEMLRDEVISLNQKLSSLHASSLAAFIKGDSQSPKP